MMDSKCGCHLDEHDATIYYMCQEHFALFEEAARD